MIRRIVAWIAAAALLISLSACGLQKTPAFVVESAPESAEEPVPEEPEEEPEETDPDAVFGKPEEVEYDTLMRCFTADHLLTLKDHVFRTYTRTDLATGEKAYHTDDFGFENGDLVAHCVEECSGQPLAEQWIGYDGHSITTRYTDDYGSVLEHVVYSDLEFYFNKGILLVNDLSGCNTIRMISTQPCEYDLYETVIEYRSGSELYATGVYGYQPADGMLRYYEVRFYCGEEEPVMTETGVIICNDEADCVYDPSGLFGYCYDVEILYQEESYTCRTCAEEYLRFEDTSVEEGVLEYNVYDENGELINTGFDSAYIGSVDHSCSFTAESIWYEDYPETEPEEEVSPQEQDFTYLFGVWANAPQFPDYTVTIFDDMRFLCCRFDPQGQPMASYSGRVLTGSVCDESSGYFDYIEFSLESTDDPMFAGQGMLGDFSVEDYFSDGDTTVMRLKPVSNIAIMFCAMYGADVLEWYRIADAETESQATEAVSVPGSDAAFGTPASGSAGTGMTVPGSDAAAEESVSGSDTAPEPSSSN